MIAYKFRIFTIQCERSFKQTSFPLVDNDMYNNLVNEDESPDVNLPVAEHTPQIKQLEHPYSTTMFKEKTLETSDCASKLLCNEEGELATCFSDLPFPSSLVSHWISYIDYPCCSTLSHMPSLTSHYVSPLDPADVILSKNNIWEKLEICYQEERNSCKQS